MKHITVLFLFFFSVSFFASEISLDFNSPKSSMLVYPHTYDACWQQLEGEPGWKLTKNAKIQGSISVYYSFLSKGANAVKILIEYRTITSKGINLGTKVRINHSKKGGKNGGIGSWKSILQDRKNWRWHEINVPLPKQTYKNQLVFILETCGEIQIRNLKIIRILDEIKIPKYTPKISQSILEWKNAAALQTFYNTYNGDCAKNDTEVKISYDAKNLYVGFIAYDNKVKNLKADEKVHDGSVWNDDCVELFIFDKIRDYGWQFITNSIGTKFECELRQNMPGDPYRPKVSWDGIWQSNTRGGKKYWEAALTIPWKSLGYSGMPENRLSFNFAREKKNEKELTQWNVFIGNLNNISKYAVLRDGMITRYRKLEKISYVIKRKTPQYAALLSNEKGNYHTGLWADGIFLCNYPKKLQKEISKDYFKKYQTLFIKNLAKSHSFSCFLPSASLLKNNPEGIDLLYRWNKDYGMKYPYSIFGSMYSLRAQKLNPRVCMGKLIDPACKEYREVILEHLQIIIEKCKKEKYKKIIDSIYGIDEPANKIEKLYNRNTNHESCKELDLIDAEIKADTGFQQFGLYDKSDPMSQNYCFQRIATWRWWNKRFSRYLKDTSTLLKDKLSDIPYYAVNLNSASGISNVNSALASEDIEWIGCDPYPTSANANCGFSRALYHTGFTVKILKDLVASQN